MRIAVKDANILIDLESMGLLDLWFQLEIETLTTSIVVNELICGNHHLALTYVESGAIESVALDPFELALRIEEFEGSGLSEGDVSVFLLAEQRDAFLLSGDAVLRENAEVKKIEVHGTIWILEQMIKNNILVPVVAASKLEYLVSLTGEKKRFLPLKICRQRIAK